MPILQEQTSGSYFLSLPKEYVNKLGWKAGDIILVLLKDDKLVLEK